MSLPRLQALAEFRAASAPPPISHPHRVEKEMLLARELGAARHHPEVGVKILFQAASHGFEDALAIILHRSHHWPDIIEAKTHRTLLMAAAHKGHAAAVAFLLPFSDVSAVDSDGLSALMIAARAGAAECCALIAATTPFPLLSPTDATPLIFAAQSDDVECMRAVLPYCRLRMRDAHGQDALSICASHANLDGTQMLLDAEPWSARAVERALAAARSAWTSGQGYSPCAQPVIDKLSTLALALAEQSLLSHCCHLSKVPGSKSPRI